MPVTKRLKSKLNSFLSRGFVLKKTRGNNNNGNLMRMSFNPDCKSVVFQRPNTCNKKTEINIQKSLLFFNAFHFSFRFPSNTQLLHKIIWGILVGTVPNNILPPIVQIPNKKIVLCMAGENIDNNNGETTDKLYKVNEITKST